MKAIRVRILEYTACFFLFRESKTTMRNPGLDMSPDGEWIFQSRPSSSFPPFPPFFLSVPRLQNNTEERRRDEERGKKFLSFSAPFSPRGDDEKRRKKECKKKFFLLSHLEKSCLASRKKRTKKRETLGFGKPCYGCLPPIKHFCPSPLSSPVAFLASDRRRVEGGGELLGVVRPSDKGKGESRAFPSFPPLPSSPVHARVG